MSLRAQRGNLVGVSFALTSLLTFGLSGLSRLPSQIILLSKNFIQ
jgi:hypothetical protein